MAVELLERCPVCRAQFKGQAVCHRCEVDLTPLLAIAQHADNLQRQALGCLMAGDSAGALAAAEKALQLRASPLGKILVGFVANSLTRDSSVRWR